MSFVMFMVNVSFTALQKEDQTDVFSDSTRFSCTHVLPDHIYHVYNATKKYEHTL